VSTETGSGPPGGVLEARSSSGPHPAPPQRDTRPIGEANMRERTMTRVRWWGLTLIGVWGLWGAFAWTQEIGTAQIELMPPHPTPNDRLVVRLFGDWRNACVPMDPQLSITGSEVRIETTHPDDVCTQFIASWELFVSVGQLPRSTYQILVIHTTADGRAQQIGQAEFAVRPITGG
jgi:hypothetical protein